MNAILNNLDVFVILGALQIGMTLVIVAKRRGARDRATRVRRAAKRFVRDYQNFVRDQGVYGR
jgi:hypothetical protein